MERDFRTPVDVQRWMKSHRTREQRRERILRVMRIAAAGAVLTVTAGAGYTAAYYLDSTKGNKIGTCVGEVDLLRGATLRDKPTTASLGKEIRKDTKWVNPDVYEGGNPDGTSRRGRWFKGKGGYVSDSFMTDGYVNARCQFVPNDPKPKK